MRLCLTIKEGVLGIGRRNEIDAYCEKHNMVIEDPSIDAFLDALENSSSTE